MGEEQLESIAGYRLKKKIDDGAMGEIYLAHQSALDRTVVLKLLHEDVAHDPAKFRDAALKLTELHHTGIARLYEAGEEEGRLFFAMEYVEGTDLRGLLAETGMLEEDDALNVALGVAEALAHAWEREKIFHRDLRPGHIIIQEDGQPKLIDLGVVQLQDEVNESGEAEGIICMPAYISPEMIAGKDPDFHSDVYALGAILYQMLTGAEPFANDDPQAQLQGHLNGHLMDPRHINPGVRHSTCMFMRKMMARKPEERCASWKEIIAGLRDLLQGVNPVELPGPDLNSTIEYDEHLAEEQHAKITQRVMKVSTQRIKMVDKNLEDPIEALVRRPKNNASKIIVVVIVVGVLGAGLLLYFAGPGGGGGPAPGPGGGPGGGGSVNKQAHALLNEAREFERVNAEAWDEIIAKYQAVVAGHPGTPPAESAKERLYQVKLGRQKAVDAVLVELKNQSAALIAEEKFDAAKALYSDYDGPLALALEEARDARIDEIAKLKQLNEEVKTPDPPDPPDPPVGGDDKLPREIAAAVEAVKEAWEKEQAEFAELNQMLESKYLKAVDRVREHARKEGILEAVLNADELKKSYEENRQFPAEVPEGTHTLLRNIVTEVVRQAKPLMQQQANAETGLKQKIVKQIEDRVSELTRTDKIEEALALRAYSDKIANLDAFEMDDLLEGELPDGLK